METLLQVAWVIWLLALTWAAVLVALEVRRDRRRTIAERRDVRVLCVEYVCSPSYWTTTQDSGTAMTEEAPCHSTR